MDTSESYARILRSINGGRDFSAFSVCLNGCAFLSEASDLEKSVLIAACFANVCVVWDYPGLSLQHRLVKRGSRFKSKRSGPMYVSVFLFLFFFPK